MAFKSLVLNCTLKPSPESSNTEALAGEVLTALRNEGADGNMLRMADYDIKPGVTSDEGDDIPVAYNKVAGVSSPATRTVPIT